MLVAKLRDQQYIYSLFEISTLLYIIEFHLFIGHKRAYTQLEKCLKLLNIVWTWNILESTQCIVSNRAYY